MTHKLKILPVYFKSVVDGTKTFEVRKNDRNFKSGDIVILQEYENNDYTGFSVWGHIGFILDSEEYLQNGYVVFSFIKATNGNPPKEV